MENKAQKKVLIIIGIVLIIIAILAYVLSLFVVSNEDEPPINEPNVNNPSQIFRDDITRLDDEASFFGVQKIINDYYNFIFEKDTNALLSILDSEYINEMQIIPSNIYEIIGSNYGITDYVAKEIYYNPDSTVTYYFVKGNLSSNSIMGDDYKYLEDVCFLIIVDESNQNYVLRPIESDNIQNYAENYSLIERNVESDAIFEKVTLPLENKLSNYLAIFINFLIYNPEEAYQLLNEDTKNNYSDYNDFANQAITLYQTLSSKIFSYSTKEDDSVTTYEIVDDKQNKITIYEYYTMDFQISY